MGLGAGVFLASGPLEHRWSQWRANRSLEQAERFSKAGDRPRALLSVAVAADLTTFDPSQLRIVAGVLEEAGSPQAVTVYRQLCEFVPEDASLPVRGARVALRHGDLAAAEAMLNTVSLPRRSDPEVARALARVAAAAGRASDYADALATVVARDPGDTLARVELASLQLVQPARAAEARATLQALAASSAPERLTALRLLARDAARRNAPVEAVRWAATLAADPDARFTDRLFQLQLEHELGGPNEDKWLEGLQPAAAAVPSAAATLGRWLLHQRTPAEAQAWIATLPQAVREAPDVRRLAADIAIRGGDWAAAGDHLRAGALGAINPRALDLALAARQLADRERTPLAEAMWEEALEAAAGDPGSLTALYRLSLAGDQRLGTDATLRALAGNGAQRWAIPVLARHAHARKDTAALRQAYAQWIALEPHNFRAQADWAMASLLVDPQVSVLVDERTAALQARNPRDPQFVAARAFCLWRKQRAAEARALLAGLPPKELNTSGRSLLYGGILASLGEREPARQALQRVKPATLLPEEAEILRRAWRTIGQPE